MNTLLRQTNAVLRWLLLFSLLPLSTCSPKPTALQRMQMTGKLVVATTNSPTTCYDGPQGLTGYECDLLQGLAKKLGVKLDLQFFDSTPETVDAVAEGRADVAAASINITPARQARVRFSHPLQQVVLQLVYNSDDIAPQNLGDLDGDLEVVPGSSGEEILTADQARYPALKWNRAEPENDVDDLLYQVSKGEIDYTVANSDLVAINQRYYPNLRVAFAVSDKQDLAWALPHDGDASLYNAVQEYLRQLGENEMARLRDRYFGHINETDYQGVTQFTTDVQARLPRYRAYFEDAAKRYGLDWRVVAAIGYQESHWDPAAISPTGVRGIMMLTTETAADLKVANRENAAESIRGGARYFQQIMGQLPPQIAEPDRTWMALAAYNQGVGHLLDARALAAQLGGDPNRWLDVRNALPLLSRERWFKKTRHGYARGREAVGFVGNVRNYYDMLAWMTQAEAAPAQPGAGDKVTATAQPATTRLAEIRSADAPLHAH
ncbi:membrane-bound lytic murein transglycosylase MltF [Nevskia soli]|uniref:membrane-bound lytic murein transglycosylase MltF n=1 Tax=Nevskia soli TaxID=418856 RepID=UPI00068F9A01|nr:membrane-bound lytic murein transglycosylase MltF [Nevskia soli]